MNISNHDIQNLDNIIKHLFEKDDLHTVPEILNKNGKFHYDKMTDNLYRYYEDVLITNNLCIIQEGWKPNYVINGFKKFELAIYGREAIKLHRSAKYYIKKLDKIEKAKSVDNWVKRNYIWISIVVYVIGLLTPAIQKSIQQKILRQSSQVSQVTQARSDTAHLNGK